jgi:hypothetical protein
VSLDDLIAANEQLARLRERIEAEFSKLGMALQQSSLAFLFDYAESHPDASLNELMDQFEKHFHLTARQKDKLSESVKNAQTETALQRSAMYANIGMRAPINYEKMQSMFSVDFPRIDREVRDAVVNKFHEIISRNGDINELIDHVKLHGYVGGKATTLANAALSQYDNAYTFQIASEAAVDKFKYVGPSGERPFCQRLMSVARLWSRSDILSMSNGQGLSVLTSCGGYRCRHMWLAVPDVNRRIVRSVEEGEEALKHIKFDAVEEKALADWTTRGQIINKESREGSPSPLSQKTLQNVFPAIRKLPQYEGKTWRGLNFSEESEYKSFVEILDDKYVGFQEPSSSSVSKDKALLYMQQSDKSYQILIEMISKTGAYLGSLSKARKEEIEVLFERYSSFKATFIKEEVSDNIIKRYYLLEEQ